MRTSFFFFFVFFLTQQSLSVSFDSLKNKNFSFRKLTRNVDQILDLGLSQKGSCPPPANQPSIPLDLSLADKNKEAKKYCEAAEIYLKILKNSEGAPRSDIWLSLIDSYMGAGEDILAINEMMRFLANTDSPSEKELVHQRLMGLVFSQVQREIQSQTLNPRWTLLAMGASPEQTDENPLFQFLKFQSFLSAYPNSQIKNLIHEYQKDTRNNLARLYLNQAREYRLRRNYPNSLLKFRVIVGWGPAVSLFEETLYELVLTLREVQWSEQQSRAQTEADTILKMMQEKLSESPWTRLAEKI